MSTSIFGATVLHTRKERSVFGRLKRLRNGLWCSPKVRNVQLSLLPSRSRRSVSILSWFFRLPKQSMSRAFHIQYVLDLLKLRYQWILMVSSVVEKISTFRCCTSRLMRLIQKIQFVQFRLRIQIVQFRFRTCTLIRIFSEGVNSKFQTPILSQH